VLGHAVDATQVALVGHGDAQILDPAAEAIGHTRIRRRRLERATLGFGQMQQTGVHHAAPGGIAPDSHCAAPST
jgi:hypothetical protein